MSKRLTKGYSRVFDPATGVTRIEAGSMTKGQALIRARSILGPDAFVSRVLDEFPCVFVRRPSGQVFLVAQGPTWEVVIGVAMQSSYATEWNDRQIELDNEIEQAKDDLKKTQKAVAEKNFKAFVVGLGEKLKAQSERGIKWAEEYGLWKEGREEKYQEALANSYRREHLAPQIAVAEIDTRQAVAKESRRQAYDELCAGRQEA